MNNSTNIKNYNTKQRNLILDLLIEHKDIHLTADEMLELLKQKQTPVGKATLYRYLDMLVSVGEVCKYVIDERLSACYQYNDANEQENNNCFHLKCIECGKVYHIECDMIHAFNEQILKNYKFSVDPSKIVFYGQCVDCCEKGKEIE